MIKKVAVTGKAPATGISFFETETGYPTVLKTCEYSVTPGSLFPITSITVTLPDLTTSVITAVSAATNEATLSTILRTELMKLGYEFSETYGLDNNLPAVKVSGQTLTIISELVFTSINSAGSVSFTAKCTRLGKITNTKVVGTSTSPTITVNGTARSVATFTMGTDSAATVKTRIETGLATEISAGTVISVAVTSDGTNYTIVITALAGTVMLFNGVSFAQTNPLPYFKA